METTKIQIRKTEVKLDKTTFDSYKLNHDGKQVDLRFHKESTGLDKIPYGVSIIEVEDLKESKTSFFPRFYATYKG